MEWISGKGTITKAILSEDEVKTIEKILDIVQAELRSNYKRLGFMGSNVLTMVDDNWQILHDFIKKIEPPKQQNL